ncbi:MAG: hypothetical protein DI539_19450 [Flavobacterium psychrophilum]|nr:MAG: hypothetical protein DI539_19450 [Flavobacterium psychrophilum]
MARNLSTTIKLQGTLGGLTHVNSRAYGQHVRAERGTYTPISLNATMEACKDMLMDCNGEAKIIFDTLRDEHRDGTLWSRLLSLFFKRAKEGLKPHVSMLMGLECDAKCKLADLLGTRYSVNVERAAKKLQVSVELVVPPAVSDVKGLTHYRYHVVVLYPNFSKGRVVKEIVASDMLSFPGKPDALSFEVAAPSATAPYIVLLGISGYSHVNGKYYDVATYRGLAVVKTS